MSSMVESLLYLPLFYKLLANSDGYSVSAASMVLFVLNRGRFHSRLQGKESSELLASTVLLPCFLMSYGYDHRLISFLTMFPAIYIALFKVLYTEWLPFLETILIVQSWIVAFFTIFIQTLEIKSTIFSTGIILITSGLVTDGKHRLARKILLVTGSTIATIHTLFQPCAFPITFYWLFCLLSFLPLIRIARNKFNVVIVRKLFHLLCLCLFIPPLLFYPSSEVIPFIAQSSLLVLFGLLSLEIYRLSAQNWISDWLTQEISAFVDDKTEFNSFVYSHIGLLAGCLLPIWMQFFGAKEDSIGIFDGLMLTGVGDAVAAVVGVCSRRKRMPWCDTNRSVQGFFAFLVSCLFFKWIETSQVGLNMLCRLILTALLECYTSNLDNLILPIYFISLVGIK
jgi:hypothetical protein